MGISTPGSEPDVFGYKGLLTALPVLLLAAADLLWQPWHLGWWDTPFAARVVWQVSTGDGRHWHLGNDFMCPYEREYGRMEGLVLSREPNLHGHLGIVFSRELRDRIIESNGDRLALTKLKTEHGHVHFDRAAARAQLDYLAAMFGALNKGARKSVLPGPLCRLKAPGGQLFYWGDLPRYRGDLPVRRIAVRYQERFYHAGSGEFSLLADTVLHEIDIPVPLPTQPLTQGV